MVHNTCIVLSTRLGEAFLDVINRSVLIRLCLLKRYNERSLQAKGGVRNNDKIGINKNKNRCCNLNVS